MGTIKENYELMFTECPDIVNVPQLREMLDIGVNLAYELVRPDYVSEHFKILLNNLGLRHIRFHDLRHSCASLLLAKGIPMKAIQEWLGHSNFSTTANIYAHLDSNSKQLSAQVITSAFETKKEIEESDSSISLEKLALAN